MRSGAKAMHGGTARELEEKLESERELQCTILPAASPIEERVPCVNTPTGRSCAAQGIRNPRLNGTFKQIRTLTEFVHAGLREEEDEDGEDEAEDGRDNGGRICGWPGPAGIQG
jgi:hypothetical protein